MKIGIFTPTYNRPDFIRNLVLQINNQILKPSILVIHQNGQVENYKWVIKDIKAQFEIKWIHTNVTLPQDKWYSIPLQHLVNVDCEYYFWCDHDDIYFNDHIAEGISTLMSGYDYTINSHTGLLLLKKAGYTFDPNMRFKSHEENGHSSSMCFNKKFAIELLSDLYNNNSKINSDVVVSQITKKKFRHLLKNTDKHPTTVYVCHSHTVTSSHLLKE